MLFLNAGGGYSHNRKNLLYGYNYEGIVDTKTTIDRPTDADYYNLYANISKAFSFWQMKVEVSGGTNSGKSELLLQNEIHPYHTRSYSAGCSVSTTQCRYFCLSYRLSWMQSQQWVENKAAEDFVMRTHSHEGKIWIFPTEKISVNPNVYYQYYNETANSNMVFADALVRYSHKHTKWELECNNLFNAQRIVSTTHSSMGTYVHRSELRPLSILLKVRFKLL